MPSYQIAGCRRWRTCVGAALRHAAMSRDGSIDDVRHSPDRSYFAGCHVFGMADELALVERPGQESEHHGDDHGRRLTD